MFISLLLPLVDTIVNNYIPTYSLSFTIFYSLWNISHKKNIILALMVQTIYLGLAHADLRLIFGVLLLEAMAIYTYDKLFSSKIIFAFIISSYISIHFFL